MIKISLRRTGLAFLFSFIAFLCVFFTPLEGPILQSGDGVEKNDWFGRSLNFIPNLLTGFSFRYAFGDNIPFAGIVIGDNVNIRAGADLNFEIISQLNKGDKVIVIGESYNWYKIRLSGLMVSCYINRGYVDVSNEKGVVKGNNVNVRAGAGLNYNVLMQLNDKDTVIVIGRRKDWYKIRPPEGCYGWVHSDFVKYYSIVEDFLAEKAEKERPRERFDNVESSYKAELAKDPFERKLEPILKAYQDIIKTYPDSLQAKASLDRIEEIRLKVASVEHLKKALEKKVAEISKPKDKMGLPVAAGTIEDLGMIINRPGAHKLLKDGRILYYLKSYTYDLNKYIYYPVEVWGDISRSQNWKYPLIIVSEIRILK